MPLCSTGSPANGKGRNAEAEAGAGVEKDHPEETGGNGFWKGRVLFVWYFCGRRMNHRIHVYEPVL